MLANHFGHYEVQNVLPDRDLFNRNLRVKFLLNKITEIEFKTTLQFEEKRYNKIISLNGIFNTFRDVSADIFRGILLNTPLKLEFLVEQLVIFENLVVYFNAELEKIGKRYKCVYGGITVGYKYIRNIKSI